MDGYVTIGTDLDTKSFDAQIDYVKGQLDDIEDKLKKADMGFEVGDVQKLEAEYEKLTNKLTELYKKQNNINKVTEEYGNSLQTTVTKISKWGLAIFGIRSAYSLILRTAREIGNENEEVGAKLNAIEGSLTNLLAPIVEVIVNLVYRLLSYLNVITKSFLGVDLFKKSASSAKNAVGSANKLRKILAGFDEMNVIPDTSSSGAGGVSSAIQPEPIDTTNFENYVENFKSMWNELLETDRDTMAEIFLTNDETWGLLSLGWFDSVQGFIRAIQGVFDFIKGILDIIVGLATGSQEKIKEGVDKLFTGIGELLSGLFQSMLGFFEMILGVISGVVKTIINWVNEKIIKPVINAFKYCWEAIKSGFKSAFEFVKSIFTSVVNFFKNIISTIVNIFKNIGTKVGYAISGAFKAVVNGVLKAIENILNFPIKQVNKLLDVINAVPGINISKLSTFNLPRLAKGGIINMPGKGVPVGSAVGGERGAEGVIPLTDSQQMALLGEAIGKYININATVPVYVGNRMVARELKRINAEDDFAYNR